MADRKKNRTKRKSNPNTRTPDMSTEEPDLDIKTQISSIKGQSSHVSTSKKRRGYKEPSNKKRNCSKKQNKIPVGFQSKIGPVASTPTKKEGSNKKTIERKFKSNQTEEETPVVHAFVSQVCEMGVPGLRKIFTEQLAMMCPPRSKCSAFEANPKKNRYVDIVCLEASRVVLQKDSPDQSDYIHANWVDFEKHDRKFIATQGPLDHTCEDFWRMILQYNCPTIVNLTKVIEDGKPKCSQYWPEKAGDYAKLNPMTNSHFHFGLRHGKLFGWPYWYVSPDHRVSIEHKYPRHITTHNITEKENKDLKEKIKHLEEEKLSLLENLIETDEWDSVDSTGSFSFSEYESDTFSD